MNPRTLATTTDLESAISGAELSDGDQITLINDHRVVSITVILDAGVCFEVSSRGDRNLFDTAEAAFAKAYRILAS